jgi:hypothetical protein
VGMSVSMGLVINVCKLLLFKCCQLIKLLMQYFQHGPGAFMMDIKPS